jgi:hypothetical protein
MPEELPGVCTWFDVIEHRILAHDHVVEAELADHLEGRVEPAERLEGRARLDEVVAFENRQAVLVTHGYDGSVEVPAVARVRRAALGLDGVAVDVLAAPALERGDRVGPDALGHETGLGGKGGVVAHGTAVRTHGHAGHGLHTAGDHQVLPARGDLLRGDIHRLETGGAEAIELHAGDGLVPVGVLHDHLGDVRALLADGGDAAHDHVVDVGRIEIVAIAQGTEQAGAEIDGLDFVQAAAGLSLAARRAHRVVNIGCVGHSGSPSRRITGRGYSRRPRAHSMTRRLCKIDRR